MIDFQSINSVDLSRLQFGLTALYHFLFVPLTLGLSLLLAIMETIYVMTSKEIWKQMTQFWGILFGINFAMGVCTGVPLEFQFGTNWAYYSHYVGDVFGAILAIEGMMAFFLEATFVGLFFFGWKALSRMQHLVVTWLLALGSNLSALWILIANGWMQNPVGAAFNPQTLRMEVTSFYDIIFNPVAQVKFVHTVSSGYVTGAMFVVGISSYYLLRKKWIGFAKRSLVVASSFGFAAALSTLVLGDESGYVATDHQKMKVAAMEGMWETEPAPAGLALFGIPDRQNMTNHYTIKIPYIFGIISTRSLSQEVPGIKDLVIQTKGRIQEGMVAFNALETLKKNPHDAHALTVFKETSDQLGYGLLLKRYTSRVVDATPQQIHQAAHDTIPNVTWLFFAFRIMVGLGFYFIAFFGIFFFICAKRRFTRYPLLLKVGVFSIPLPWIAAESGWIVAECGRQPWTIDHTLPTFLSASNVDAQNVWITLMAFVIFYTSLAVIDVLLMIKYIRKGPLLSPVLSAKNPSSPPLLPPSAPSSANTPAP